MKKATRKPHLASPIDKGFASLSRADIKRLMTHIDDVWKVYYEDILANEGYEERGIKIDISERILSEAVMTAISDLDRMMDFHFENGGGADRHKFSAFMSRWIAKFRPVQFVADPKSPDAAELYELNATFAVYVFCSFLTAPIPAPVFESLVYTFHYRDLSGEALSMLAYTCEEAGLQMARSQKLLEKIAQLESKPVRKSKHSERV